MKHYHYLLITAMASLVMACNNGNTPKEESSADSTAAVANADTTAQTADAAEKTDIAGTPDAAEEKDLTGEPPSFSGSYKQTVFTPDDESDTPRVLSIEYNSKTKKATGQWIVPKGSGEDVWPQIADMKGACKNGIIVMKGEGGLAEYTLDVKYIDARTININGEKYVK